jgi:predicted PurR-regulated permease PerM
MDIFSNLQVNALNQDSLSNAKLEEEVLQLWDRLYTYMTNTSTLLLPDKNRSEVLYSPQNHTLLVPNIFTQIQTNFDFHLYDLYNLIRGNLGLLRTVLDSVWTNTTLLLTLLSTIISLLFTGGFALFNFLVSFIVFVTVLFYLLSHSDQPIYRPTEWLNNTLSVGGKGLGKAVNDAVTSVFVASLKIAAFYGLYTYVLHTVVGSNLVFLPAVIASICAVTLKSYWAALPGCLDLWLVQQRPLSALLLLLGQIAPVYVVDTAIYSEVKGGAHQVNSIEFFIFF